MQKFLFEKKVINLKKNKLLSEHLKVKKNYQNIMKKKNIFILDDN